MICTSPALKGNKIPADCRVARSVNIVLDAYHSGKTWKEARELLVEDSADLGWFQAPANVGYVVVGLLYGEGDFKKCSGCWYLSIRDVALLYQLFCFTKLLLVKSWSNSKWQFLNCVKQEQKNTVFCGFTRKIRCFTNYSENHIATQGHSHSRFIILSAVIMGIFIIFILNFSSQKRL